MSWTAAALTTLTTMVLMPLLLAEVTDWCPWLARRLVLAAVRHLPREHRARYQEEWLALLAEVPGKLTLVVTALGLYVRARSTSRALRGVPPLGEALRRWLQAAFWPPVRRRALLERISTLEAALLREQQTRQLLAAAGAMKDMLLLAVSHDLRTPLTAILGLAVTLQRAGDRLPREQSSHLLYMLVEKARKLDRMLTDLLDLNRMERGLLEPNRTPTDIGAMVRRLCSELDQLEGRPVHIDADPIVAAVDAPKVERIIENLLVNTCKHTPQGTPVWVRLVPGKGRDLEILVEDAGPGVPPELQADIFEPFRQEPDGSRQPARIGLYLAARFAMLHGGRAWVTDRDGGGASFHVLLPGVIVEDEYPHPVFDPVT